MRIIVGYDGSQCSDMAVRDLVHAGLPQPVQAMVVSVADLLVEAPYADYPLSPSGPPPAYIERVREQARQAMAEARRFSADGAELIRSLFPSWEVQTDAVADSPYWALIKMAEKLQGDLVLVGSHGRSALGRLLLGSVSQFVLSYCPCSVRIGRGRKDALDPHRPLRIVLGFDGSIDAKLAVNAVCSRRWPEQSVAHVVMALDPRTVASFGALRGWPAVVAANADELVMAQDEMEKVCARLRQCGLLAVPVVQQADPKHALLNQAQSCDADCIFLGARGHSRLERFLLGSVSAAVAARAQCSVEVIRQAPWSQAAL